MEGRYHYLEGPYLGTDDGRTLAAELQALPILPDSLTDLYLVHLALRMSTTNVYTVFEVAVSGVWHSGLYRNERQKRRAIEYAHGLLEKRLGSRQGRVERRTSLTEEQNALVERLCERAALEWGRVATALGKKEAAHILRSQLSAALAALSGEGSKRRRVSGLAG